MPYKGYRLGKRDKKNRIRVLIEKNNDFYLEGVKVHLKDDLIVYVDSHEDANKILGVDKSKKTSIIDKGV